MTGAGKGGDEYGKQGGTVTGAQLVKQMFGEVEQVLPVATGQKNLLGPWRKSEFNKRAGVFVHAEARVTGDPAIRAGAVVQVEKAGKRVDGQYYVVSTDHLFFVDTGLTRPSSAPSGTRSRRAQSPVKDLGKFAKAVQDARRRRRRSPTRSRTPPPGR